MGVDNCTCVECKPPTMIGRLPTACQHIEAVHGMVRATSPNLTTSATSGRTSSSSSETHASSGNGMAMVSVPCPSTIFDRPSFEGEGIEVDGVLCASQHQRVGPMSRAHEPATRAVPTSSGKRARPTSRANVSADGDPLCQLVQANESAREPGSRARPTSRAHGLGPRAELIKPGLG